MNEELAYMLVMSKLSGNPLTFRVEITSEFVYCCIFKFYALTGITMVSGGVDTEDELRYSRSYWSAGQIMRILLDGSISHCYGGNIYTVKFKGFVNE